MTKGTYRILIDDPDEEYPFARKFAFELTRAFPDNDVWISVEGIGKFIVTIDIDSKEMLGDAREIVDQWDLELEPPSKPDNIIVFKPFEDVA